MATWKKVLTEQDIAADNVSVQSGQTGLATGNAIAAAIAASSAAASAGDITSIAPYANGGVIVHADITSNGTFVVGDATAGDAKLQIKAGTGITVTSTGVNLAATAAGTGLTHANGVLNVAGQEGVTITADAIAVNTDDATIAIDATLKHIMVKDGGLGFEKLSGSAVHTYAEFAAGTAYPSSSDNQLVTAKGILSNFTNVTLAGTPDYITAGGTNNQTLTLGVLNITDDTNLSATDSSASTAQDNVHITLSNSTLSAVATGLSTTDNVQFGTGTFTGALTVNGAVTLGTNVTDDVTINGNLTVLGNTTTLDVSTLTVEDKLITVGSGQTTPAAADRSGVHVSSSSDSDEFPSLMWRTASSGGALSGWMATNHLAGRATATEDLVPIAMMDVKASTPSGTSDGAGVGSFWFDTAANSGAGNLYIRTV